MSHFILKSIGLNNFKPSSRNKINTKMNEGEITITASFIILEPISEEDKRTMLKELSDKIFKSFEK